MRVLIVDDEHLARQAMRRLLAAHPDAEIVGEAASLAEAMDAIERTAPQLVFLDIELGGGGDGFDLLAALERPPIVVFVTAYAEHAVEAFTVQVKVASCILMPNARHEILQETDAVRTRFWAAFDAYLGVDAKVA